MLESGNTQFDSRILVVNSGGGQMRIELNTCSRVLQRVVATRTSNVNGLSAAFLISSTAILSVILGVFGAYCAISGLLAALNPSRPNVLRALVPHQSPASGD